MMLQRLSDNALSRHFPNGQMNLVEWRLWRLETPVTGKESRKTYMCVDGFIESWLHLPMPWWEGNGLQTLLHLCRHQSSLRHCQKCELATLSLTTCQEPSNPGDVE